MEGFGYYVRDVEVLVDKTKEEFGYHPNSLLPSSHERVYVRCRKCREEFLRERRVVDCVPHCCMGESSHSLVRCESQLIHEDAKLPARSKEVALKK